MNKTIGFAGLGNMGLPMALKLVDDGYKVRVWNRSPEKCVVLSDRGATPVPEPAAIAEPGGIVISMLADDTAVEDTTLGENGILSRLGADGVHVSMSTISPAAAARLAEAHDMVGACYVAAPVFGRPEAAKAGKLWIVVAGPEQAKQRVETVFDVLGQGSFDFGEKPEKANVVKLVGNFLIASAMEAMAEAFTLAEKHGIDRREIAELFSRTLFPCPIYQNYGKAIAENHHEPARFKLSLGLKDLDLVLKSAAAGTMPMPLADLLYNRFITSVAKGRAEIDWTGLALAVSEDAGLT